MRSCGTIALSNFESTNMSPSCFGFLLVFRRGPQAVCAVTTPRCNGIYFVIDSYSNSCPSVVNTGALVTVYRQTEVKLSSLDSRLDGAATYCSTLQDSSAFD